MTISTLEACSACTACDLASSRQTVVISRGNPKADLMLIGEAPGAQEDAQGVPFVGRSGRALDQLLRDVDLDPDHDLSSATRSNAGRPTTEGRKKLSWPPAGPGLTCNYRPLIPR